MILNFFFHMKNKDELESVMLQKSDEKSLDTLLTVADTMASMLTLGYYSNDSGKPKTDYLFDKHPETCEFILQDIKSIIKLFLLPFVNSEQFLSASYFTVIGGPVYSNEKFKNLNPH